MTWTTVALFFVVWCLVSVVAGFAFAFFFGGMNRIHPEELEAGRLRFPRRSDKKTDPRRARRRVKAGTRAVYRPAAAGGAPDPPLDEK
ncbi:MAG: hypothetical protein LJF30_25375 [Acidobacteria bacterium]|nr:hypothetical protein [Acidobacteriota bacterium]